MARPEPRQRGGHRKCEACHRDVHLAVVDGEVVATDPEVLSVVRYGGRTPTVDHARRVHAERCADYQNEAKRAENTAAMRRFTQRQQRGRRGFGL